MSTDSNGDFGRKIHRNYKGFKVGDLVVTGEINMQKKKKSSFGFSGR